MAGVSNAAYFQTSGTLLFAVRHWILQMIYILNFLAGVMFCYLLYKSKLVPRFISVLGFIGYAVILPGTVLHIFGHIGMNQVFIIFALGSYLKYCSRYGFLLEDSIHLQLFPGLQNRYKVVQRDREQSENLDNYFKLRKVINYYLFIDKNKLTAYH